MDLKTNFKLHNNFKVVIRDTLTDDKIIGKAENVVLNNFYKTQITRVSDVRDFTKNIIVGSGSNIPSATDTGLQTQILSRANNGSWNTSEYKIGGTGILKYTGSIQIGASELVGSVIREVGISGYNGVATRAILQDSNGNPLEITKTDTMVIDIYATIFLTVPRSISGYKIISRGLPFALDANNTHFLSAGKNVVFSARRLEKDWYEPAVAGTLISIPTASFAASISVDEPNMKHDYSIASIAANSGNVGGIRALRICNIEIPVPNDEIIQPVLVKEVVGTGDGTTTKFATKFGWIRDNATIHIYVNDIEQVAGVTAIYNKPACSQASFYLARTGLTQAGAGIYEKVVSEKFARAKCGSNTFTLVASDSLEGPWTSVLALTSAFGNIPEIHQNKRYWSGTGSWALESQSNNCFIETEGDIQFEAPVAVGAVVSVTYQPDCIAKDDTRIINNLTYSLGL